MLSLLACTPSVVVTANPDDLAFGDVVFGADMPEGGWAPLQETSLTNEGEEPVTLELPQPESELCLDGFPEEDFPASLGSVDPGSSYVLRVGICEYTPGDAGSEVEVPLLVDTPADPVTITITFTPIRDGD